MKKIILSLFAGVALITLAILVTKPVSAGFPTTNKDWAVSSDWTECKAPIHICGNKYGLQTHKLSCVEKTGGKAYCNLGTWVDTTYSYTDKIVDVEGYWTLKTVPATYKCPNTTMIITVLGRQITVPNTVDYHFTSQGDRDCFIKPLLSKLWANDVIDVPEHQENDYWTDTTYKCPEGFNDNGENCIREDVAGHYENPQTITLPRVCTLPEPDYTSCRPEESCPTECGYNGGNVNNGQGGHKYCDATEACPVIEPTVTPTGEPGEPTVTPEITPEATPSATPTDVPHQDNNNSGGGWQPPAPTDYSCHADKPEKAAANFHLYRRGDGALLKWMPAGRNAPEVNVYYRLATSNSWEHAVRNWPNDGNILITGLGKRNWKFAVQQTNGCAGGELTPDVLSNYKSFWFLFR